MHLEPEQWAAWYLDDVLLFNASHLALGNKTSPYNASEAVGSRQVPVEPLYIAMDLMGSPQDRLPRDALLQLPARMEVDWVRLYQSPTRHSLGCDAPARPTRAYIDRNADLFETRRCGDGRCDAGECEQCPRDCLQAAACRQDCRLPRCQVRVGGTASASPPEPPPPGLL